MSQSSAFVIAGTHSGVGKTTVALGIMAALRRRDLKVQPFKIGPDFIDPGLHSKVCGLPSYNLDGWMLSRNYNLRSFQRNMQGKDIAVLEGMMGLYDGRSGTTEEGSTAEMAKELGLPVILVVDASAIARSVAAMILGYRQFDPELSLLGVIFNRVGGERHLKYLRDALKSLPGLHCFGGIPTNDQIKIPERHLGLIVAEENFLDRPFVNRLVGLVESHVDLDLLLRKTRIRLQMHEVKNREQNDEEVPVAIARDKAFCFYYPDNLDLLRTAGAKLKPFSPIADHALPTGVQGIYLGGGYPELYADELSGNQSMKMTIRNFVESGRPVYAECGGLMYLAAALVDTTNREYPMVGVYPFKSYMLPKLQALAYRRVVFSRKSFLPNREQAKGHEFHYSELKKSSTMAPGIQNVYTARAKQKTEGCAGYLYKNCLASYAHLHFGSNPKFAMGFVEACRGSRG